MMIDMDPDVTVIVPVYNTAAYLEECIRSVLSSSDIRTQVVVVDDGSTDGSYEISRRYAEKYSNIECLRQERKYQGAARNLGIARAKGEFVAFLDSDDILPEYSYSAMATAARRFNACMVAGIQQSFSKHRSWIGLPVHQREFRVQRTGVTLHDMPDLISDISACNRLIRRSFLLSNEILFPEVPAGEDAEFMARVYLAAKSIVILPRIVYRYRSREGASTKRVTTSFFSERAASVSRTRPAFLQAGAGVSFDRFVLSELRKLVSNRLHRAICELPYPQQVEIFDIISSLARKVETTQILESRDLDERQKMRGLMLRYGEYRALVAFERQPESRRFIDLIDSPRARDALLDPVFGFARQLGKSKTNPVGMAARRLMERFIGSADLLDRLVQAKTVPLLKYFVARIVSKAWSAPRDMENIWLIDERISSSAEDNGFVLFRYLQEHRKKIAVYFVLDRSSQDWKRCSSFENIVPRFSFKHAWLLSRASVLASTDSFRSLAYPYEVFPSLRRDTINVFLQHGVSGNKTTGYLKSRFPYINHVIVSTESERQMFVDTFGFETEEVCLTGIARFDFLPIRPARNLTRKILVAPTWRDWLRQTKWFESSEYFHRWNTFLRSRQLREILDEYGCTLYFYPHFSMNHFLSSFSNPGERIHVFQRERPPLSEMVSESDLLITDYSSVMYDFFHQAKPVIAYMFDEVEWVRQPKGPPLVSFSIDLPVEICHEQTTVLRQMSRFLSNRCQLSSNYKDRSDRLFAFRDQRNCDRIYRSISTKQFAETAPQTAVSCVRHSTRTPD